MYVIGTAGHIDHGKSALVEALTGIDPDRLREEKSRGMTIDLGFAWLPLPGGATVSIVDVPGHERFLKNMLAGAGGIDLALLVVAADDGVMPQTREHLAILDLLGVSHGVVALTKRDLVDEDWRELVRADIEGLVSGTSLRGAPIVACSPVTREGLDELVRALDLAIRDLPPKRNLGRPRLPIDRVFTIGGFGTVVTGTLVDGELEVGQEVEILPGGLRARIRGLQSHKEAVQRALPGSRTAVNLAGIEKDALRRGMTLSSPGSFRPTDVLDARVRAVEGLARPLRHNMRLSLHCFADEQMGTLRLLESDELRPGEEGWAQVKLDAPIVVARGDRFVLRTPDDTVGGGVVADASPRRHRRRDTTVTATLSSLLDAPAAEAVLGEIRRRPFLSVTALAGGTSLAVDVVAAEVDALRADGAVLAFGEGTEMLLCSAEYVAEAGRRALEMLNAYHADHPLRAGMPREELRRRMGLDGAAFDAITEAFEGVRFEEGVARASSFERGLSEAQEAQVEAYVAGLRAAGEAARSNGALDPELFAYLVERGRVVDCGNGVVFDGQTFDEMAAAVRGQLAARQTITLAEARDLLGTSRKQAQAFLEELDRRRVTRRAGDARVLR